MTAALTAIAFLLFTLFLIRGHLKRSAATGPGGPAAAPAGSCPRCGAGVPADATICPRCRAPRQVFELITAAEVTDEAADSGRPVHAIVRKDMCIGCGSCVAACPEPGAIRLVGKLAVVDRQLCRGHGRCAEACPVGGIALSTGAAVQRVEVPALDGNFQSSVPGLYIVGELGGRGLIKNAINEATIAIEAIARDVAAAGATRDAAVLDVVIVGAGPAGLSAGLAAIQHGLRYAVLERGTPADTIRRYPRHKVLFAEPVNIPLYGDLWITDASKEALLDVWQTIITTHGLQVRSQCAVRSVAREDDVLTVETDGGPLHARRVVLAMGRRGTPRRLGVPGEELPHVFYDIAEVAEFQGARVLVVGGGDSAIESAVGLANQPGTTVCLAHRGASFDKAKARNRDHLAQAVAQDKLRLIAPCGIREIRPTEVVIERDGESIILPIDYVIVRIGGEAPFAFLERVGVRVVKKDLPLAPSVSGEPSG